MGRAGVPAARLVPADPLLDGMAPCSRSQVGPSSWVACSSGVITVSCMECPCSWWRNAILGRHMCSVSIKSGPVLAALYLRPTICKQLACPNRPLEVTKRMGARHLPVSFDYKPSFLCAGVAGATPAMQAPTAAATAAAADAVRAATAAAAARRGFAVDSGGAKPGTAAAVPSTVPQAIPTPQAAPLPAAAASGAAVAVAPQQQQPAGGVQTDLITAAAAAPQQQQPAGSAGADLDAAAPQQQHQQTAQSEGEDAAALPSAKLQQGEAAGKAGVMGEAVKSEPPQAQEYAAVLRLARMVRLQRCILQ